MVAILASSFSGSSISISAFPELSNRENPLKLDGRISAILVLRKTGRKCEKLWMWLVEFFAICLLSERWVPEHLFPNHSIKILYPEHGIDEDILLTEIRYNFYHKSGFRRWGILEKFGALHEHLYALVGISALGYALVGISVNYMPWIV